MADITYTGILDSFDVANKKIKVKLIIPKDDPNNKYEFNHNFDLSQFRLLKKNINAVFCHLKLEKDPGNELNATSYDYDLEIDVQKLINHQTDLYRTYDFDIKEFILLVFHDNNFDIKDVEYLYENLTDLYDEAKNGNFKITLDQYDPKLNLKPRTLGVSIIRE